MLFSFFKKKQEKPPSVDPVVEAQMEQTYVRYTHDMDVVKDRLSREYTTAESAIEDYRKGYLTEEQLKLRFTKEEIDLIHSEQRERDRESKEPQTGSYL